MKEIKIDWNWYATSKYLLAIYDEYWHPFINSEDLGPKPMYDITIEQEER